MGRAGVWSHRAGTLAWVATGLLVAACGPADERAARAPDEAVAIDDQEDAVCGMLVREQSAPRAQLVHADGERAFFCSIGDLLVHLGAPSPHGAVRAVFVEVLRADEDPALSHKGTHPWLPAASAAYVVGVERGGVMGAPVLVYEDAATAGRIAEAHAGARVLDFDGLQDWWRVRESAR